MDKFSFEVLTRTDNASLQEQNRSAALNFKANLEALAVEILTPLEAYFNCDLRVLSAFRSCELNSAVGGAKNSEHTLGSAVDILLPGVETEKAFEALRSGAVIKYGQLILEKFASVWLHISLPYPYRSKELCGQSFLIEKGEIKDFRKVSFYD